MVQKQNAHKIKPMDYDLILLLDLSNFALFLMFFSAKMDSIHQQLLTAVLHLHQENVSQSQSSAIEELPYGLKYVPPETESKSFLLEFEKLNMHNWCKSLSLNHIFWNCIWIVHFQIEIYFTKKKNHHLQLTVYKSSHLVVTNQVQFLNLKFSSQNSVLSYCNCHLLRSTRLLISQLALTFVHPLILQC